MVERINVMTDQTIEVLKAATADIRAAWTWSAPMASASSGAPIAF